MHFIQGGLGVVTSYLITYCEQELGRQVIPKREPGTRIQNLLTLTLTFLKIFHNRRGQGRDGERGRLDLGRDAVFLQAWRW